MNKEEEIFKRRMIELANKSYQQNIYTYTNFLDMYQQELFYQVAKDISHTAYGLYGGHAYGDRVMISFGSADILGYEPEYPMDCILLSPAHSKYSDKLTHRDFLGALTHIGIDRSNLGDILTEDNKAYIFCTKHITPVILEELTKVKHTNVICSRIDDNEIYIEAKYQEHVGFVSSCRLDSILGLAFKLSRSQSITYVQGKKVFVNGRLIQSNSFMLKNNDVISVRGMGKFIYEGADTMSKKGRYHIILKIFI